jgi:isorenieratene synthase
VRVVVVGAGIAGLAAAAGLAERGVSVDIVEREPYLGGRVGGWTDTLPDGAPVAMNRGFHAFFRQYYNLRKLLQRIDPRLSMLTPVSDYPLVDAHGRRDVFRGLPKTPPFNALAFALRSPTFRLGDLWHLNARAAASLIAVSVPDIYRQLDHLDAETFLRRINFPDAARHLAFEVFSRSFSLNRRTYPPPSSPRCFTSTSSGPAKDCCSTSPTPISMSRCGIRYANISKHMAQVLLPASP